MRGRRRRERGGRREGRGGGKGRKRKTEGGEPGFRSRTRLLAFASGRVIPEKPATSSCFCLPGLGAGPGPDSQRGLRAWVQAGGGSRLGGRW